MDSKAEIRRIQVKRIGKGSWEWAATEEMTSDEAIQRATEIVGKDETIFAVRITRMTKLWTWMEEFSGDREFNYIGMAI